MSTNPVDFSDLEGDLDSVEIAPEAAAKTFLEASAEFAQGHTCQRCRGTGRTPWGRCFRCEGSGKQRRAPVQTDAASVKRREQAKARKLVKARQEVDALNSRVAAWRAEHPAADAWIMSKANAGNGFAHNLLDGLLRWGSLTPGQLAAVERALAQDAERAAERAKAVATQGPGLDLTGLPSGMYAVPEGETRLKVKVSRPKAGSRWYGFIFVSDGAEYGSATNYGRQAPGGLYSGKLQAQLTAIMADPAAASAAYGKLVGRCGVCGRLLEDEASVERGIGPICAGKLGWAS